HGLLQKTLGRRESFPPYVRRHTGRVDAGGRGLDQEAAPVRPGGERGAETRVLLVDFAVVMDPARKRTARLIVALTAALLLAGALVYTSFSAGDPSVSPSALATTAVAGKSYQVTGKVSHWQKSGSVQRFVLQDRTGAGSVPIVYDGPVPDPFRNGREVIITVRKQGGAYVGEKDSLITKCPSKYSNKDTPA
ncbi:MAG: cytochrome c maturation protein CcmE, partial [Solirubrobacterales bacterium]|nr:cytochrome c maturation protein CcmE [Solirubrobacterales bacterium]